MTIDTSTLPYQQTPAKAEDVTEEFTKLTALVTAIVVGAGEPLLAGQLLKDGTKEPGTSLVVQKFRATLALDSYVSNQIEEAMKLVFEVTSTAPG